MKSMLDKVAMLLVVIGGINWGLVGALNFNLVNAIFGSIPVLEQVVYIVVGLCSLYWLYVGMMSKD